MAFFNLPITTEVNRVIPKTHLMIILIQNKRSYLLTIYTR